jgi:hypothetical protein
MDVRARKERVELKGSSTIPTLRNARGSVDSNGYHLAIIAKRNQTDLECLIVAKHYPAVFARNTSKVERSEHPQVS